jgi:hypothetical protein
MEGMKNTYDSSVGKSERKRPLARVWSEWEDSIKLDLK